LELVEEFVKHIKGPVGKEKERCESCAIIIITFSDEKIEKVLVYFPSVDAIMDAGSGD
jgi:hypothetical protein